MQKQERTLQGHIEQQRTLLRQDINETVKQMKDSLEKDISRMSFLNYPHEAGFGGYAPAAEVCTPKLSTKAKPLVQPVDGSSGLPSLHDSIDNHNTAQTGSNVRNIVESWTKSSKFEFFIGCLIICNIGTMFVELQWKGYLAELAIGLRSEDDDWKYAKDIFNVLDHFYNIVFIIELGLHVFVKRCTVFRSWAHIFDFVIVLATTIDSYVLAPLNLTENQNIGMMRIVRIFRVVRVLRVVRVATQFAELRIIVRTLVSSATALFWSMLLICLLMLGAGIFVASMTHAFLVDETKDDQLRASIFEMYGSASRASWTMFEVTLSGCWPSYARPLVQDVDPLFYIFWAIYIAGVSFALLRVISALFLKETMRVANDDREMVMMEKLKQKEKFAVKLREFFEEADTSGDGFVSSGEFEAVLSNPSVKAWLHMLELEVYEVTALFNLLDDGDDKVSFEEFLQGAMRLKGNARAIDSVAIQHQQHKTMKIVEDIHVEVAELAKTFLRKRETKSCGRTHRERAMSTSSRAEGSSHATMDVAFLNLRSEKGREEKGHPASSDNALPTKDGAESSGPSAPPRPG